MNYICEFFQLDIIKNDTDVTSWLLSNISKTIMVYLVQAIGEKIFKNCSKIWGHSLYLLHPHLYLRNVNNSIVITQFHLGYGILNLN